MTDRSQQRKRLVLVAPNLYGGGAERTLARLANHWSKQGRFVTVVTIAGINPEDFPLEGRVDRIGLGLVGGGGLTEAVRGNYERIKAVRWAIRELRPDVVVSFIDQANVLALLAAKPLGVPVVISERTDPVKHEIGASWRWMRRRTYRSAAALVVLTQETARLMSRLVASERIAVIPNAIPTAVPTLAGPFRRRRFSEDREQIVLAVGRLAAAKGFDRLIEAVGHLHRRGEFSDWRLVILGDGPDRESLEAQAADLPPGMVEFVGRVADPTDWYRRASLFALPSRYEGFPNALLEAMAEGLPAVAFENGATRQIIRHEWDGLIVPEGDTKALAEAMYGLLADADYRESLGRAACDVADRFSEADFCSRWDSVIDSASLSEAPDLELAACGVGV